MMDPAKKPCKFSIGVGDRFGAEADVQLRACEMALEAGVEITPVWNKSNREHTIIGSDPSQIRRAADAPQTPAELLIILAAIASERIPIQTIAPKFSGRFNKGVDYVGDVARFAKEFWEDIAVIRFAVNRYGLASDLKLSVHSGSDKFSIYPAIRQTLQSTGAGVHVKTAGAPRGSRNSLAWQNPEATASS